MQIELNRQKMDQSEPDTFSIFPTRVFKPMTEVLFPCNSLVSLLSLPEERERSAALGAVGGQMVEWVVTEGSAV